ncbi:ORF17 [Falcon aviadenovirus A]|nr:ORF17 [Falcon aviadenovirus A]
MISRHLNVPCSARIIDLSVILMIHLPELVLMSGFELNLISSSKHKAFCKSVKKGSAQVSSLPKIYKILSCPWARNCPNAFATVLISIPTRVSVPATLVLAPKHLGYDAGDIIIEINNSDTFCSILSVPENFSFADRWTSISSNAGCRCCVASNENVFE